MEGVERALLYCVCGSEVAALGRLDIDIDIRLVYYATVYGGLMDDAAADSVAEHERQAKGKWRTVR